MENKEMIEDVTAKSFEEYIEELESIVQKIELGQLTLDENLELYEKGMKLVRICNQKLEESECKIEQIVKRNGEVKILPFDISADE